MSKNKKIIIGIDIGTVSIKGALLVPEKIEINISLLPGVKKVRDVKLNNRLYNLFLTPYKRHSGKANIELKKIISNISENVNPDNFEVCFTGVGAKEGLKHFSGFYVNEFQAAAQGVGSLYPDVKTIFEIGGEKSKYLLIQRFGNGDFAIEDYEKNGECAAGTGSFFDQQAERLEVSVEDTGKMILSVNRSPKIAGRCSVFAKSDMIHAQQRGYKPNEVLKGLAEAIVRNFAGNITKGKDIIPKVAFIGGLAFNRGIVESLKEHFNLDEGNLIVPIEHASMGAVGAAISGIKKSTKKRKRKIYNFLNEEKYPVSRKLSTEKVEILSQDKIDFNGNEFYLGIDIGSISTNFALINEKGELLAGLYKMTAGKPIKVVQESMREMFEEVGKDLKLSGVGTTGSGRELVGHLIGADVVKDEITAHKTGAQFVADKYIGKKVDTIFEIGGQDSKFISISDGVVIDFSLNDACAAGTGSFLEEQAKKLGIDIKNQFADMALKAEKPVKIGERCTVFMEKEIDIYLQKDIELENIVAGISLSVVHNYLNRVVKKRKIGETIFFQGGTAYNKSVAAAFSTVLDKKIIVPPFNGIIGAIGAALLAKQKNTNKSTKFRGWDLREVNYKEREFVCKSCSNHCTVKEFTVEGEKSYWGDKCSVKYRKTSKSGKKSPIDSLFLEREKYIEEIIQNNKQCNSIINEEIYIPYTLFNIDKMVFWHTYFSNLGFKVIKGEKSSSVTGNRGIEVSAADPCFPVQLSLGHLVDAFEKNSSYVFYPNVINEQDFTDSDSSYICPWGQTLPLVAKHTPALSKYRNRLLYPNVQFREGEKIVDKQLFESIGKKFRIKRKLHSDAVLKAFKAQDLLYRKIIDKGSRAVRIINDAERPFILLVGRSYNMYDFELNLHIPDKLENIYGVPVVPMDFIPFRNEDISEINDHMFWNYGKKILQAAKYSRKLENCHIIYISNFKCGPDSYIRHYMEEAAGEPYLFLQLDSHANDAGVMTRIEAYLESKEII